MAMTRVMSVAELPPGTKKTVKVGETEILLVNDGGRLAAVQSKCPHAGAPLEKGAVCHGRLVCPWHMGTFALPGGELVEPPPMQGLTRYAIEARGDEVLVDPTPIAPARTATKEAKGEPTDSRTFVLVGAGAAGAMAATTLRQEGFGGRLVVIDPVEDEPVDRTQLSKMALAGKKPLDGIGLGTFKAHGAERVCAAVTELSARRGEVRLTDGRTIAFDAAFVATGGVPQRPEIPGAEMGHTIRHTEDVRRLLKEIGVPGDGPKKRVAVIGTSFIGMEAASALVGAGVKVTVIGKDELPFAEKFGDRVAKALVALHRSKGTEFRLGVEPAGITTKGVTVKGVTGGSGGAGSDGDLVAAEVVILGVGVEPTLEFEHDLQKAKKGGVNAPASLKAAKGVWVGGDIASVEGLRIEHWRLAQQHGMVAAKGMIGQDAVYDGVPFFWTFHFGKRLGYVGHADEWDEIVYDGDVEGMEFLAYYIKSGKVAAILTCGRDTATAMLAERMRGPMTIEEARAAAGVSAGDATGR